MLTNKRSVLLVIIFISLFEIANGQYNHQVRASLHGGAILKHRSFVKHLVKGPVYGVELNYIRPSNGSKLWHTINNHPDLGFGCSYYYLNNEKELGELYSIHALLDLYLINRQKSYFTMRLSPGVTYASKFFNTDNNYKHNLLGSSINGFINFKWAYGYRISNQLATELAFGIAHSSNGAYQSPNLGINLLTTSFNIKYQLNKTNVEKKVREVTGTLKKNILQTHFSIGRRQNNKISNEIIQCATLSVNYYRAINHSNAIGGGMDLFYRKSNIPNFDFFKFTYTGQQRTYYQMGLKMNYNYRVGNMEFPFEVGLYVIDKYKKNGVLFNRIGLRYHLYKNLMAHVTLKLHAAQADYFEWGLGYNF
jgi:hypothetical protein